MVRLFISQPGSGTSVGNLSFQAALKKEEVEVVDSFFQDSDRKPLEYLGDSLKLLAGADWVWFCEGWEQARGCKIENLCAREYGIPIIHA